MLARGVLFLFLLPETTLGVLAAMQFENLFYIYLGIPFVIGISLTYMASAARTKAASIVTVGSPNHPFRISADWCSISRKYPAARYRNVTAQILRGKNP